ncbi:MAG: hypothetical protein JWO36_1535 [Myxococcales bacterium]|nr:hypothetical protein [Myxococcales bacterium]
MTRDVQFSVPSELELSEFFETDPIERSPEDGYWCYEVIDRNGVKLRFSFNLYERSVQTVIETGGTLLACISHEGATELQCTGAVLHGQFRTNDSKATLTLVVRDAVRVDWSTLRTG